MNSWIVSMSFAVPLAAACLTPAAVAAQARPTDILVSVTNSKGEPASGLSAEDFTVREDGVAREVLKVAPATDPLDIALLVDDSQAAEGALQFIRDGLHRFAGALAGKAAIALITYGERPTIVVDYTTDEKKWSGGIDRIFPRTGSGAYMMDAVVEASRGLQKREPKRPAIVDVAMNGVEFSNRYYATVVEAIEKSRAAFHVITLGEDQSGTDENRNRNEVVAVGTERTGGRRDQILTASGLPMKLEQLADELTHQYVVTYARPQTLIPPEKIEVRVKRPGLTARARTRTAGK